MIAGGAAPHGQGGGSQGAAAYGHLIARSGSTPAGANAVIGKLLPDAAIGQGYGKQTGAVEAVSRHGLTVFDVVAQERRHEAAALRCGRGSGRRGGRDRTRR